jgi:hypothetical protein
MALEFTCPSCASTLSVDETSAGRLIRCGGCQRLLRVPHAGETATQVPESRPAPPPESFDAPPLPVPDDERALPVPDEYEAPRRRRRPLPPPGRGPVFWVLLIFGILFFGTCTCCGGIYALLPGAVWRTHDSIPGGFRVELPAEMNKNMTLPNLRPDPRMQVEGTILWKRGEVYVVMHRDFDPKDRGWRTDEQLLDEAVKGIEQESEVRTMVRKEPLQVSGFPAREIEYVGKDGGTCVGRIVVAGSRLYVVVGGGRFVRPGNANIRRFVDSFEVTGQDIRPQIKFKP